MRLAIGDIEAVALQLCKALYPGGQGVPGQPLLQGLRDLFDKYFRACDEFISQSGATTS